MGRDLLSGRGTSYVVSPWLAWVVLAELGAMTLVEGASFCTGGGAVNGRGAAAG